MMLDEEAWVSNSWKYAYNDNQVRNWFKHTKCHKMSLEETKNKYQIITWHADGPAPLCGLVFKQDRYLGW